MSATIATASAASAASAAPPAPAASAASDVPTDERRARASIDFGRERGYYRLLFDAGPVDAATFAALADVPEHEARLWLDEQRDARVLRAVRSPSGESAELLLPGEYVPILLGDAGEPEFDGARALLAEHRAALPDVLVGMHASGHRPPSM